MRPLALLALLSAPLAGATPIETLQLPAADGTLLNTDIYRKDATPRPVLVLRGGNARAGSGTIGDPAQTSGAYDVVVQDIRSTIDWQAPDYLFGKDGSDGRALLSWVKTQPWCNGRVWMEGWSNGGIVDDLAAPGADATLRAINPNYATGDLLNYGCFSGGVWHRETADGLVTPGTPWEDYVALPLWDDALIDDVQASTVNAAGLHRGGWFDIFGQGTLDTFERLETAGGPLARAHQKLVMGPWIHGGGGSATTGELTFPGSTVAASPLPALGQALQTGVMTGDWTSWNALPAVNVYVMGESPGGVWKTYSSWPPPAGEAPFYLTEGKTFEGVPGDGGSLTFHSDPLQPGPTLGGTNNLISCVRDGGTCGPYDQRPIESRSDVLVFTSVALSAAGETIGRLHADLWIETALPDVDLFVRMTDVYPDGRSMLMAQGIARARYRNGSCPELLTPGQPALVPVDLGSTALVLAAGHKLRVIISAAADPLYAVNPQNGDEYSGVSATRAGDITLLTGGSTASVFYVPVAGGTAAPPDRRPDTHVCTADAGSPSKPDAGATQRPDGGEKSVDAGQRDGGSNMPDAGPPAGAGGDAGSPARDGGTGADEDPAATGCSCTGTLSGAPWLFCLVLTLRASRSAARHRAGLSARRSR